MSIKIGDNNKIENATIVSNSNVNIMNSFQKNFPTAVSILEHLAVEFESKYDKSDKTEIIADLKSVVNELKNQKPLSLSDKVKSSISKAFSFLGDSSSIAGLVLAIASAYKS